MRALVFYEDAVKVWRQPTAQYLRAPPQVQHHLHIFTAPALSRQTCWPTLAWRTFDASGRSPWGCSCAAAMPPWFSRTTAAVLARICTASGARPLCRYLHGVSFSTRWCSSSRSILVLSPRLASRLWRAIGHSPPPDLRFPVARHRCCQPWSPTRH